MSQPGDVVTMATARLQRLLANLACSTCAMPLDRQGDKLSCRTCGTEASIRGDSVDFSSRAASERTADDWLLRLKERVKRTMPRVYNALIAAISPVYAPDVARDFVAAFDPARELVIDYGSGPHRHGADVVNIDIAPYPEVDLVVNGAPVPLRDGCADALLSIAVLEHVPDPVAVVADFRRLLKPGGKLFVYVPFMQGIHAAPDDFTRWAPSGLMRLFEGFDDVRVEVGAGPTSSLVWMLQEWFAIAFSFGSPALYKLLYIAGFAFAPLKFLDALLARHPMARNIASAYVVRATKSDK